MDADEQLGQQVVSNGLLFTKIYHAAHLIGIDPDYRIYVSDRLLKIHDGPLLELGLKGIVGQVIKLPRRNADRPDRTGWHFGSNNLRNLHSLDHTTDRGEGLLAVEDAAARPIHRLAHFDPS